MSRIQSLARLELKKRQGYINSPETREKMRLARLGKVSPFKGKKRPRPQEERERIRKAMLKYHAKHPRPVEDPSRRAFRWRLMRTSRYKHWRKAVFERDNYTCHGCGKDNCYIEAHHIKSFAKIYLELKTKNIRKIPNNHILWNIKNGLTLCLDCHKKTDSYKKRKKHYGTV